MFRRLGDAVAAMPWLILAMARLSDAACECGYSVNKTSDPTYAVYTDLMENDFLHSKTTNVTEIGWRPQQYSVTAKSMGDKVPFGKDTQVANVNTNPLKDANSWSGAAENGGDAGLQLWVRGDHSQGYVHGAEVVSVRGDTLYGSYRVGMKMAATSGTCGSFFWYYNNSQEIDMEFLSKSFNESNGGEGQVYLVLQTLESALTGSAENTSDYKIQPLAFAPDDKFHEYRFDWSKDAVDFYIDGTWVHRMTENIPQEGSFLHMNHWSNGDPNWSAGPPDQDTVMTISYVKAYFNTSDDSRVKTYNKNCPTFDPAKVCAIPAQTTPPDVNGGGSGAQTYFFSEDNNGSSHSVGQTTYHTTNAASLTSISTYATVLVALITLSITL